MIEQRKLYNRGAEQQVIGGLLIEPMKFSDVADYLTEDDFFYEVHSLIFQALNMLTTEGRHVDILTIEEKLTAMGKFDEIGGRAYLAELGHNTVSSSRVIEWAKVVKDLAAERRLKDLFLEGINSLHDMDAMEDSAARINNALTVISKFDLSTSTEKTIKEIAREVIDIFEYSFQNKGALTGVNTGMNALNERFHGFQKKDFIILAARPSMGKTTLAVNLILAALKTQAAPVIFFSLEMGAAQIGQKFISRIGQIDFSRLKKAELSTEEYSRLTSAVGQFTGFNLIIDDRPGLTMAQIKAKCLRTLRKHKTLSLVVIDYLTLIRTAGKRSRTEEVGEVSRALKALAKELDCPVIALAQLNRGVEQRTDKRPMMSDLRDSGEIEQDADVIMFIYRDVVYHPETEFKNLAEIITAKNRNGEVGTDYVKCDLSTNLFTNLNLNARK